MKRNEAVDFWARTERNGECLDWKGCLVSGYGHIAWEGKKVRTHKLAFFLVYGRWPRLLRHTCDRKQCVNVEHLVEGTQLDNMRDAVERGLLPQGERHRDAKLTAEKVEEAKRLRSEGWSYGRIAKHFGVSDVSARKAVLGLTWRTS